MEVDYDAELLTESPDNAVSMAANPSLLAVMPVNEQFYLSLIKVIEFCALPSLKL